MQETRANLQDKLDQITSNTRRLVQPERLAVSEQATADLLSSGIEDGMLPIGATAPPFSLEDAITGQTVNSTDLLALGPLVISFFRGRWCPYCVTELETWRDLYAEVRRLGAVFAAISPQNRRQNAFTAEHLLKAAPRGHLFPILSDPEASLASKFGIAYTVPISGRSYYRSILVNIPFANSGQSYDTAPESAWRLPLPATLIIRQDATIAFAEAHADSRVRPEPASVLDTLASLSRSPRSPL